MADLIIEDVSVGGTVVTANGTASGTFAAGSQFSVTFDVRNNGTTSAGTSTAAAYMNVNGTPTRLDTNPTSSLSAGSQDTNETLSFIIPASLSPGVHAVVIRADDNSNVSETNEGNNSFGFGIRVVAPTLPDLIIEDVVVGTQSISQNSLVSSAFAAGQTVSVTFDVRNQGSGNAAASTAAAYLIVNGATTRMDTESVSSIAAGSQDTNETLSFSLPTDISPGNYGVIIVADDGDAITESGGGNNSLGFVISVQRNTAYTLTPNTTSVTEGGKVSFTITRTGDRPQETVYFSTLSDGTATFAEGDYRMDTGAKPENIAVNFTTGQASTSVTLDILAGDGADSPETFRAIVQRNFNEAASVYLDRSSFVTINEVAQGTTYTLTPNTTSVTEGGKVTYTITRTGDRPQETVYFSTLTDGTATYAEGDYRMDTGAKSENIAVNFTTGQASNSVTLDILAGDGADSPETFRAIVQRNFNEAASVYLDRSSFVTINEGAQGTTYTLTPNTTSVAEGGKVSFAITRTGDRPAETVYFSTLTDGTATFAEGDYRMDTGAKPENIGVAFTAGQTTKSVTLDILAGDGADSPETFRAIVQRNFNDAASVYLDRSSFVTINEAALTTAYTVAPNTTSAIEGGKVVYTITRTGDTPAETLYFSTKSNTASFSEGDYRLEGGGRPENVAVKFGMGDKVQNVTLDILSNDGNDSPENFSAVVERRVGSRYLELANSAAVTITEPTTVVINDTGKAIDAKDPSFLSALKDLGTGAFSFLLKVNVAEASEFTTLTTQVTLPNTENSQRQYEIYFPAEGRKELSGNWKDDSSLGGTITDRFGFLAYHLAADLNKSGTDKGTLINAVQSGTIIYSDINGPYGKTVVIEHKNQIGQVYYSLYAHLDELFFEVPVAELGKKDGYSIDYSFSQKVFNQDIINAIGTLGETGDFTHNPHLHLEIFQAKDRATVYDYLTTNWKPRTNPPNPGDYVQYGYTGTDISGEKYFKVSRADGQWIAWHNPVDVINNNTLFPASGAVIAPDKTVVSQISTSSPIAPKFVGQVNFDTAHSTISSFIGSDGSVIANIRSGPDKITSFRWNEISKILVAAGPKDDQINFSNIQKSSVDQNTILVDGDAGNDIIDGTFSGRHISARGGADDDTLTGGNSPDDLFGDDGNDMLQDSFGDNLLNGGAGNDRIAAHTGKSELLGEGDDDLLVGGIAGDILDGGTGSDVLIGDILASIYGRDTLSGGAGNDLLTGGGGSDTFVFRPNEGSDTIATFAIDYATPSNSALRGRDFQTDIDILDLRAFGYLSTDDAMSKFQQIAGSAVFADQGTTVNLFGVTLAEFSASNIIIG